MRVFWHILACHKARPAASRATMPSVGRGAARTSLYDLHRLGADRTTDGKTAGADHLNTYSLNGRGSVGGHGHARNHGRHEGGRRSRSPKLSLKVSADFFMSQAADLTVDGSAAERSGL